eukprot:TRINITY_DN1670_c0_g1_i2.p1 TRINITY_DN1670_c0_g1~~TRINITY_DN1670_c0_g1_i2.p1  ORF type:complete len:190 (-),score=31.90 TRINITY_DN1670_c0_g1_i2:55-624(-)
MAVPFHKTEDGFESQWQVNHLGHFLLTNLLLDKLKSSAPSRIINLTSRAHFRFQKPIPYEELSNETEATYERWEAYGRSKLANILFTYELHKQLNGENRDASKGVAVFAVHPGLVATELLVKAAMPGTENAIPVSQGADTPIYLASDEEVAKQSGYYYWERKVSQSTPISYEQSEWERCWLFSSKWALN